MCLDCPLGGCRLRVTSGHLRRVTIVPLKAGSYGDDPSANGIAHFVCHLPEPVEGTKGAMRAYRPLRLSRLDVAAHHRIALPSGDVPQVQA